MQSLEPPSALAAAPLGTHIGSLAANPYRSALRLALSRACGAGGLAAGLDESLCAALAALGRGHRVRARAQVFAAGSQQADSLWLLVSGKVSLGKRDGAGRWWQSLEIEAGEWIDPASAWTGGAYAETAIALTPVVAHEFPADAVAALCHSHPALTRILLASVARRASGAVLDKQALLTKDVQARLAAWLLQQLELSGGGPELQLRQQKKDIASQLGVTPETLSRTLRQLQQDGLLQVDRYLVHIPDLERLQALAERRPPRYSR